MPVPIPRLAHRQVVGKVYETDARRFDSMLHGERDGGDAALFDGVADQPDGPVAQGSGRREQHRIDAVFYEFSGHLGGRLLDERRRVVDGAHKGEMARA